MARVGIAAGTWTAVSNGVSRRQANRWGKQDEQQYYEQQGRAAEQAQAAPAPTPAPAQPAGGTQDTITQLKELAELKSQGILTEDEFAAQKAKILAA
jgi:Short C-terminal domain